MVKKKNDSAEVPENGQRVNVFHSMDSGLKDWLDSEKRKTGRSVSYMIELALNQWRDRIIKRRKYDD